MIIKEKLAMIDEINKRNEDHIKEWKERKAD